MTLGQHAQHRRMVLRRDRDQPPVADPDDRGRASIMGVVLVRALVIEHTHPRRQLRRHVQHPLARGDELLGQQRTESSRTLDGPYPLDIRRRELQQPIALMFVRAYAQLVAELLAFVQHRREMRTLARIDPDREHHQPPDNTPDGNTAAGKPEESRMPDPVSSHTAAEHRQAISSLEGQPRDETAGHSRDHPPAPETLRAHPIALAPPSSFRAICARSRP